MDCLPYIILYLFLNFDNNLCKNHNFRQLFALIYVNIHTTLDNLCNILR